MNVIGSQTQPMAQSARFDGLLDGAASAARGSAPDTKANPAIATPRRNRCFGRGVTAADSSMTDILCAHFLPAPD
jgi:hypothetical protein